MKNWTTYIFWKFIIFLVLGELFMLLLPILIGKREVIPKSLIIPGVILFLVSGIVIVNPVIGQQITILKTKQPLLAPQNQQKRVYFGGFRLLRKTCCERFLRVFRCPRWLWLTGGGFMLTFKVVSNGKNVLAIWFSKTFEHYASLWHFHCS